jgi:alpha-ketoglutarate-dependent taurine dioxygenase
MVMHHTEVTSSHDAEGHAEPFLIRPVAGCDAQAAVTLATTPRDALSAQLLVSGALLFRGFELRTTEEFGRLVDAFSGGSPRFGYAGGASPRRAMKGGGGNVYNSTEYPPAIELSLHNELSYTDVYPSLLFFFCLVAPGQGGATTLGDSRRILSRIDGSVLQAFRTHGVRYVRNLSADAGSGYSWQDAFETDDPAQAEAACRHIGASFEWWEGFLRVSQVRPAIARHPVTGEDVWFNQADGFHPSALDKDTYASLLAYHGNEDAFRLTVSFGDGTPIRRDMLDEVRAAIAAERCEHQWQAGDVLVLDNLLMAHGRAPFTGSRKIALAMV